MKRAIVASLVLYLLTPVYWETCIITCSQDLVSPFFLILTGGVGLIVGLFSPLNWVLFFIKFSIGFLAFYSIEKLLKNQRLKILFYVLVFALFFIIPSLLYSNFTLDGQRESLRSSFENIYTIGRSLDSINQDLVSNGFYPLNDTFRTSHFQGLYGESFKFTKCFYNYKLVCFDQDDTLVYTRASSISLTEHSRVYQRLAETLDFCESLFTQDTCVLNPQDYFLPLNVHQVSFFKAQGELTLSMVSFDASYTAIDIYTSQGDFVCTTNEQNMFISLNNCEIVMGNSYVVLITSSNNLEIPTWIVAGKPNRITVELRDFLSAG